MNEELRTTADAKLEEQFDDRIAALEKLNTSVPEHATR
jgi:hypothetical protein